MNANSVSTDADLVPARLNVAPQERPAVLPAKKPNLLAIIGELIFCTAVVGAALFLGTIIAFVIAAFLGLIGIC